MWALYVHVCTLLPFIIIIIVIIIKIIDLLRKLCISITIGSKGANI